MGDLTLNTQVHGELQAQYPNGSVVMPTSANPMI
jgi:hypothetical protein